MTNHFLGLAQRTLGLRQTLQPSIASMFEPGMLLMDDYAPTEAMDSEAMTVESSAIAESQYCQPTIAQSPTSEIDAQFFFRATQPQLNEVSFNVPFGIEQDEARLFSNSITARAGEGLDSVQRSEFRSFNLLPNSTSDWRLEQNIENLGLDAQNISLHTNNSSLDQAVRANLIYSTFDQQSDADLICPEIDRENLIPNDLSSEILKSNIVQQQIHDSLPLFSPLSRNAVLQPQSDRQFIFGSLHSSNSSIADTTSSRKNKSNQAFRAVPVSGVAERSSHDEAVTNFAQQSIFSPLSRNAVLQPQSDRQVIFDSLHSSNSPIADTTSFRNTKNSQPFHTVPMPEIAKRLSHDEAATDSTQQPIPALVQQQIGSTIGDTEVAPVLDKSSTTFNSLLTQARLEAPNPIQRSPREIGIRAFSSIQSQSCIESLTTILPHAKTEFGADFLRESPALTLLGDVAQPSLSSREREQGISSSLLPWGEGLGMRAARIHASNLRVKPWHYVDTHAELKVHAIGINSPLELQPILSLLDEVNEVASIDRGSNSQADRIAAKSLKVRSNNITSPQKNYGSYSNSQVVPLVNRDRLAPTSHLSWTGAMNEAPSSRISARNHTTILNPETNQNIVSSIDEAVSDMTNAWAVPQDSKLPPTSQEQVSFYSDVIDPLQATHLSNRTTSPLVQRQFGASGDLGDKAIQDLASYESSAFLNSQTVEPRITANASVLGGQVSQPKNVDQPSLQPESRTVRKEALSHPSMIRTTGLGNQTQEIGSLSEQEAWTEITSDTVQIERSPSDSRAAAQQFSPPLVKKNFAIAQSDTTQAQQHPTLQAEQSLPADSQVQPLVQFPELSRDRAVLTDQETEFSDRISHQPNTPPPLQAAEADPPQNRKRSAFSDPAPRPPMPRAIAYFRPSLKLDDYLKRRQGGRS